MVEVEKGILEVEVEKGILEIEVEKEYLDVEIMFRHKFHFGKKKPIFSLENAPNKFFNFKFPISK